MKKEKKMLIPKGWIPTRVVSVLLLWAACIGQGLAQTLPSKHSPFGIHGENQYSFDNNLLDVGIKVVRYSGGLPSWDMIEKTKGSYDWSKLDSLVSATYNNNITMMFTVRSFNKWDQGVTSPAGNQKFPKDIVAYLKFLKTMVERYDGDGNNDAPGSPTVEYFQIENEVDGNFWDDTPEKYAELLKVSYKTVKDANPAAIVLIAGVSVPRGFFDFYVPSLSYLYQIRESDSSRYFDLFDLHWYGNADEYNRLRGYSFRDFVSLIDSELKKYNWSVPFWISETATHGGSGVVDQRGNPLPEQDETVQASNLIERYVYYIAHGVEMVMWYKMIEVHHTGGIGIPNDYFENTGLINNPLNDGLSHKKLSYYAYKKMVEMLEGSDWKNIATVQEQNSIYIYKFTRQGKPVWVAWNDSSVTRTVTISGISQNRVRATEAVPKYESGKDVADYTTAFRIDTLATTNGVVMLTLGERPVFVEPLTVTSVEEESESIPKEFVLYQNYPNPFNPTTNIKYRIQNKEYVSLKVYDVLGREVTTLVDGELNPGVHSVVFNARGLPSSVISIACLPVVTVKRRKC